MSGVYEMTAPLVCLVDSSAGVAATMRSEVAKYVEFRSHS